MSCRRIGFAFVGVIPCRQNRVLTFEFAHLVRYPAMPGGVHSLIRTSAPDHSVYPRLDRPHCMRGPVYLLPARAVFRWRLFWDPRFVYLARPASIAEQPVPLCTGVVPRQSHGGLFPVAPLVFLFSGWLLRWHVAPPLPQMDAPPSHPVVLAHRQTVSLDLSGTPTCDLRFLLRHRLFDTTALLTAQSGRTASAFFIICVLICSFPLSPPSAIHPPCRQPVAPTLPAPYALLTGTPRTPRTIPHLRSTH